MLRRSVAAALLLLAAVAAPGALGFVRPLRAPMSMKQQRPEQQGRAQGGKGSKAGLGQAVARAVGQSLAVGGMALSSLMGLGLGLGLGVEGAGAAGGGWQYDKQTVQKQVARVDKAEQKELRDEVKDPASVIAKVCSSAWLEAVFAPMLPDLNLTHTDNETLTIGIRHTGHRPPSRYGGLPARAGPPKRHQFRTGE